MGLRRIVLRDFVIVHHLELEANSGFTVLTGETGAGKSILIDGLQWALGARAETAMIREGAARAEVAAEFDPLPRLTSWLNEGGFESSDALLLRRSVDQQGRSRAWINGTPCTASQLRALSEQLVDIHGQHAWQSLTRAESVRDLLDRYAQTSAEATGQAWREWRAAEQAWQAALLAQETRQAERDRLMWQLAELEKLNPGPTEWEELNTHHSRLANAQALLDAANQALRTLQDDEDGVERMLNRAGQVLLAHAHIEPSFAVSAKQLEESLESIRDVAHQINSYLRRTEPDPAVLAHLDERLSAWLSLARRLRRPPTELFAQRTQWLAELAQLDSLSDLAGLERQRKDRESHYRDCAHALSAARRNAAKPLSQAVTHAMQELGMKGGRFEIEIKPIEASAHGVDNVQFLVAGHSGSAPRPVAKVASGGELSRIALAIAVCTSELGLAPTLIFDEVDSGVGGAVAETVGRLMKQLGHHRQVLCVTHLPQVAACADSHWVVQKAPERGAVQTRVHPVSGEARVREVARMLAGERLSTASLAHAQDMLAANSAGANG